MPKKKKQDSSDTPLGGVAKEIGQQAKGDADENKPGPIVFEGLHHPEDDDDNPNYPADGIWR